MGMLTKKDLESIGSIVQDKLDDALVVVNEGFTRVENRLTSVENRMTGVENRMTGVENRMTGVENRLTGVEATMVTKDYLDRKLAPINGKINVLVDVLHKNRTITDGERDIVRAQA